MTINERLNKLIKGLQMNTNSFSKAAGVSEATTRTYTVRGSKPNSDYLEAVFRAFANINAEWLLTGEGGMFKPTDAEEPHQPYKTKGKTRILPGDGIIPEDAIPLYDIDITAGNVARLIDDNNNVPVTGWLRMEDTISTKGLIGVKAVGDSMATYINGGDTMLIRKLTDFDFIPPGHAYVVISEDLTVVKYLRNGSTPNLWCLKSHNSKYEDFEVPKKKVKHLFIVVKVLKELSY